VVDFSYSSSGRPLVLVSSISVNWWFETYIITNINVSLTLVACFSLLARETPIEKIQQVGPRLSSPMIGRFSSGVLRYRPMSISRGGDLTMKDCPLIPEGVKGTLFKGLSDEGEG